MIINNSKFVCLIILSFCLIIVHNIFFIKSQTSFTIDIPKMPNYNRSWGISSSITQKELNCMALNIYFEARGEPIEGQYAVGDVVMHRVMHYNYPNTICEVIKEGIYSKWNSSLPLKYQCAFSWWCDRKPDIPVNGIAFEIAMQISKDILTNPIYKPTINYALFYHAGTVKPKWSKEQTFVIRIGDHYFYK